MALSTEPNTPRMAITEIEGGAYVELVERGLPYRPIAFGGKQRIEFTWYPGSPNATTQMLGPEESAITMKGFWKDAYLRSSFTAYGEGGAEGGGAIVINPTVANLVRHVDTMRRRGQVCEFEWGEIKRIGHITEFTQTWHNVHDCEWELTFSPLGQDDAQNGTPVKAPAVSPSAVVGSFTQAVVDFNTRLSNASSVVKEVLNAPYLDSVDTLLFNTQQTVTLGANLVYTTATSLTAIVLRPAEAANRFLTTLSQSTVALANTGNVIAGRSVDALFNFRSLGGGLDSVPLAKQTTAYQWQRLQREGARASAETLAGRFAQTKQALQQELLAVYTARENQDLSSVSTKYYGRPDYWHQLMDYNGLKESRLDIGQVVLVPKLTEINPNILPTSGGY